VEWEWRKEIRRRRIRIRVIMTLLEYVTHMLLVREIPTSILNPEACYPQ
jgi:hypothetical protein